jgi:hypothetical protein
MLMYRGPSRVKPRANYTRDTAEREA